MHRARHPGIVDPGINPSETLNCRPGKVLDLRPFRNIGHNDKGHSTFLLNFERHFLEGNFVPGSQYY